MPVTFVHIELISAAPEDKPIAANLLQLHAYDFSEFHALELGATESQGYTLGDKLTAQNKPSRVDPEDSVSKVQESRIAMDRWQPWPVSERTSNTCGDLMTMAQRELSAFITAVAELFGPEQARLSAEAWLDELASMDWLPGPTSRDWRAVTIAALVRLAKSGEWKFQ
jgi:hypothetical protein